MVYLSNLSKITEEKYKIGYIHYKPFDEKHGLGKTKEELEKEGVLIENIPEAKRTEGKYPIMYFNPVRKEVFYEYEDIPKTEEQIVKEQVGQLGKDLAQEKLLGIQKTKALNQLGLELAKTKLDIIKLQGGK